MADGYDPKSCNALEKPFYRPVEAAIRWCGLIQYEGQILSALDQADMIPKAGQFPQWPCLQSNTEKILDAILQGDLPHGRDGAGVAAGDHVKRSRLTVRHGDLRAWMLKHYPGQKPPFLFDETERATHAAINADSFRALQVELERKRNEIKRAEEWSRGAMAELEKLRSENQSLRAMVAKGLTGTERNTLLGIIAVMAVEGYGFDPAAKRFDRLGELLKDCERRGFALSDDTLRAKLRDALSLLRGAGVTE